MEKYHIYDEIGKGEFSQVFKGREKKKIEYVAIKRVDKSMMSKIVNEVQTMHKLESPHAIRFHDWYETKNNLWLILEYCTGSDLRSLLVQDGHLPETSVRLFAVDIMAALAYLHSNGLIHCDIRPANMLIDEYGILKLSDFKFVRKVPKVADAADGMLAQLVPPEALGYMAPECLSLASVPSFSSDLWSVGCVLFQLRRGYMPFGSVDAEAGALNQGPSAANKIFSAVQRTEHVFSRPDSSIGITIDYNKVPGVSAVFADLVSWLLEKDPLQRSRWRDLASHPFWAPKVCSCPQSLPPQPAHDAYIKRLEADQSAQDAEYYESKYDDVGPSAAAASSAAGASPAGKPHQSPAPASPSQAPPAAEQHRRSNGNGNTTPSRPPKEGSGVAAAPVAAAVSLLQCAHDAQVRPIVNNRAIEVIERPPYKASSLPCAPISIQQVSNMLPTELEAHLTKIYKALHKAMAGCVANCTVSAGSVSSAQAQQQQVQIYAERMASLLGYLCTLAPSPEIANVVMNTQFLSVLLRILLLVVNRHRHLQSVGTPTGTPNSKTPGSAGKTAATSRSAAVGSIQQAVSATVTDSACLAATALALMLRHATFVQPVQMAHGEGGSGTPDRRAPGSPASQSAADASTTGGPNIVTALVAAMAVVDAEIAAVHGSHSAASAHTPSKQTASSLNRTARSPSGPPAANAHLDGVLRLKLRLTAALGELAFYVSAQDTAPSDNGHSSPSWHLPEEVWNILVGAINAPSVNHSSSSSARGGLRSAEEIAEITKHYATKTIENILATGGGDILFSAEANERSHVTGSPARHQESPLLPGLALLETAQRISYEPLQVSSAMTFGHLLRYLCQTCVRSARGGARAQLQAVARLVQADVEGSVLLNCVHALKDATLKLQHAFLNVISVLLHYSCCDDVEGPGAPLVRKALESWRGVLCDGRTPLLAVLCALLEQSSSTVVRAKALLCVQLLDASCRAARSNRVLRALGDNRRFIAAVSRCLEATDTADGSFTHNNSSLLASPGAHKEGQSASQQYAAQCARSLVAHVQRVLKRALDQISGALGRAADSLRVQEGQAPAAMAAKLQSGLADACNHTEQVFYSFDSVRACVAVSSSPLLLKLVLCDEAMLRSSSELIRSVKSTQLVFHTFKRLWSQAAAGTALDTHGSQLDAFGEMISAGEQVALSTLESIAQLELQLEAIPIGVGTANDVAQTPTRGQAEQAGAVGALAVYAALLLLIPPALRLLAEPSTGDVRVLVSVCMRRLLPNLLGAVSALYPGPLFQVALSHIKGERQSVIVNATPSGLAWGVLACVVETVKWLPQLLMDKAPVPQYAVRLAADLSLTSYSIALLICHEIRADFTECGGGLVADGGMRRVMVQHRPHRRPLLVDIVSRMLPAVASAQYCPVSESDRHWGSEPSVGEEEDSSSHTDPQAGVLLRMLVERASSRAASAFLSSLHSQGHSVAQGTLEAVVAANNLFVDCLLGGGLAWALRESISWAVVQGSADHLSVLLDLLQQCLELLISRSGGDHSIEMGVGGSVTEFLSQRNSAAEFLNPLAAWLAGIVSCVGSSHSSRMHQLRVLDSASAGRNWATVARALVDAEDVSPGDSGPDATAMLLIQDGCVACLALLSELSPAHFVKVLALRHGEGRAPGGHGRLVCLDVACHDVSSVSADNLPPLCSVSIAETLSSPQADIKIRIKYMKMLIASCKTCTSFGGLEQYLNSAFISHESELHAAVIRCAKDTHSGGSSTTVSSPEGEKAIYVSFQRLAANFVVFLDAFQNRT